MNASSCILDRSKKSQLSHPVVFSFFPFSRNKEDYVKFFHQEKGRGGGRRRGRGGDCTNQTTPNWHIDRSKCLVCNNNNNKKNWKRNVAHYQHPQHQKTIAPTDRAIEQAMGRWWSSSVVVGVGADTETSGNFFRRNFATWRPYNFEIYISELTFRHFSKNILKKEYSVKNSQKFDKKIEQ